MPSGSLPFIYVVRIYVLYPWFLLLKFTVEF